jgi:hypothetical protein
LTNAFEKRVAESSEHLKLAQIAGFDRNKRWNVMWLKVFEAKRLGSLDIDFAEIWYAEFIEYRLKSRAGNLNLVGGRVIPCSKRAIERTEAGVRVANPEWKLSLAIRYADVQYKQAAG